jgi:hypothetical protein
LFGENAVAACSFQHQPFCILGICQTLWSHACFYLADCSLQAFFRIQASRCRLSQPFHPKELVYDASGGSIIRTLSKSISARECPFLIPQLHRQMLLKFLQSTQIPS